jgi:protein-disulfide isomerase
VRHRITSSLVMAALLMAGCAGESVLPPGGVTSDATGTVMAAPTLGGPTAPRKEAFNPFADATAAKPPAREVIAEPTIAEVMQTGSAPEMAWGRADAPVTVIKYMSLTCPYCRRFHAETFPVLKREYIDTGKVRFIIREFPIGHASGAATIALRCASPDKYLDLYGRFLAQQANWVAQEVKHDAIQKVAAQAGVTRERYDQCRQDQALIAGLNWVKDRGRTLGVIGTPNFFVNNRLVKSVVGTKEMRELIDAALAGKVAARP